MRMTDGPRTPAEASHVGGASPQPRERPDDLIVLVYVSTATRDIPTAELTAMLEGGRRRNAARDVTGLLAYYDGTFMQAIEGPRAVVDGLLKKIAADPRHTGLIVLIRERVARRQFSEHSMAFRDRSAGPAPEGFSGLLNAGLPGEESLVDQSSRVHRLLQGFADRHLRRPPR